MMVNELVCDGFDDGTLKLNHVKITISMMLYHGECLYR